MIETKIGHNCDRDVHQVRTLNTPQRLSPAAVIFLGPPGAGKGTQARHVAHEYTFPHISTGEVFRTHIAQKTTLGLQAAKTICRGMLVPDDVVCEMLAQHINALVFEGSLILDGFPRSLPQAKWLDRFLHARSGENRAIQYNAPLAIQINVERDQLLRRLAGRRSCSMCGRTYNVHFQPPRTFGICDYDGSDLLMRPDDSESVVCARLLVHDQNTFPVAEYYRCKGRLLEIDGNDSEDTVRSAIEVALDMNSHLRQHTKDTNEG
jgi:adenylate kinase